MVKTKKFSLSAILMNLDCEILSAILLILLAVQPLYGIFDVVSEQSDLIALFYGKATAIRFIGICGLLVGIVNLYQNIKRYGKEYLRLKLLKNPWNMFFLLILLWSVLTSIWAVNPHISFFSYAYRYEGLISYFAYAGVYMCGSMVRDEEKRRRIIDLALIIAAILAVFTMLSQIDGNESTIIARNGWVGAYSGTFINTNHYGYYLSIVLMLSAGRMAYSKTLFAKLVFIASFVLNEYILLKNNSFGPFLAVTIGLIGLFVIVTIRDGIKNSWWLAIPLIIFFGMDALWNDKMMIMAFKSTFNEILEVVGVAKNASTNNQTISEAMKAEENVGSGRMKIWMAAIDVWKEHLMTGCGPENVPMEMHDALGSYEAVHNEYLQVLAEMGIFGFVLYFGGQIWFFIRNVISFKKTKPASLIAYAAVATYLVSAAFGITITVSEVFFFFVLGLANGSHTADIMDELDGGEPVISNGLINQK